MTFRICSGLGGCVSKTMTRMANPSIIRNSFVSSRNCLHKSAQKKLVDACNSISSKAFVSNGVNSNARPLRSMSGLSKPFTTASRSSSEKQLDQFDPPGGLTELNEQQRADWSNWVSLQFDQGKIGYPQYFDFDGPRDQFYNPLSTPPASDGTAAKISWIGFPRIVKIKYPGDEQRWKMADSTRDVQDEYCEWSVTRDPTTSKITKVTFTCEGPEYWDFIAKFNPELLLKLYREHVSEKVQPSDLFNSQPQEEDEFQPNHYMRKNKWNSSTVDGQIMHLVQVNNTLGAEIELAAGSSVVRKINGRILTDQRELIKCGQYGGIERNSDPFIGSQVNTLTRQNAFVTLANPVGLYFDTFETPGWETPDGSDATSYWKIVRGTPETPVRAIFEVPKEKGFVVSDITINGKNIKYGAQIADFVRIKLVGYAQNFGKSTSLPLTGCRVRKQQPVLNTSSISSIASAKMLIPKKRSRAE